MATLNNGRAIIAASQILRSELNKFGWTLWGKEYRKEVRWRVRNEKNNETLNFGTDLNEVKKFLEALYEKDKLE